jgi:N-acetylglutamate synthase-like GNAT family acetyltransferase
MIVKKTLLELKNEEKDEINNLIISSFINSRLDTYNEVIYYIVDGEIIGFVGLQNKNIFTLLNQLCVKINYRNKGIGSKLLEYIEENVKTNLILYIDKNKDNTEYLYNYYLNRGYKETETEINRKNKEYKMINFFEKSLIE